MKLLGNLFEDNMAYEGGALYLESDAKFSSQNDKFTKNVAITFGGVMSVISRSAFNFTHAQIIQNYATNDAAISAFKTSTVLNFYIVDCLF
jgi:hypothetical protein